MGWSETQFNDRLAGRLIRRIGFVRWLRNLAVGLGSRPATEAARRRWQPGRPPVSPGAGACRLGRRSLAKSADPG